MSDRLPYRLAIAAYALREDSWGIQPAEPGPAGWGAVLRRGDKLAVFNMHACHVTRADVYKAAVDHFRVMLDGDDVFYATEAGGEQDKKDLETARQLARDAALTPHQPIMRVVA